jgi:hypothetical protein
VYISPNKALSEECNILAKVQIHNSYHLGWKPEEVYVAGSHGIETRYPLLDKDVVQEFLWLSPQLKNAHCKAPLHEYLTRNVFPNLYNKKIGLSVRI